MENTPGAAFAIVALALALALALAVGFGVEGAAADWVVIRRAAPATRVKDSAALMDFELMEVFTRES